jgi:hypothetical protein
MRPRTRTKASALTAKSKRPISPTPSSSSESWRCLAYEPPAGTFREKRSILGAEMFISLEDALTSRCPVPKTAARNSALALSGHVDRLEAAVRRRLIPFVFLVLMLGFVAGASAGQKPTRKPKRDAPYFVGNFDTCDFSQWHTQGPQAAFKIVNTPKVQGRCAAALTVGPWALGGLVNPQADGAALWLAPARYGTVGRTVWQHFSVRFAPGFRATTGEWNIFVSWHNDNGWQKLGVPFEYANLVWMVRSQNGVARIGMRIMGGLSTAPRTVRINGPRLRTGHWYDFRARAVWSPDPKNGVVEWWLDGRRLYSRHIATLYTRPDGSVSTAYFTEANYRLHADWNATIFLDGTRLGPTQSSVRY